MTSQVPSIYLGQLVVVKWCDAWFDADESSPADWKDEYIVVTVGFCVRDDNILSVAHEKHPDGGFKAVSHIPRVIVKEVTLVKDVAI